MKKLRIALIGQGRSGRNIHGAFLKSERNDRFEVVAVVDAIADRRARAAEEYGCDVYADYRELFGRTDIDLVTNASFSYQHTDITIDLLNHGFNVICEKPFARSYEDGCRMIAAARKNSVMVNAFQQSRLAPYYTKIKEILASGKLGDPIQISLSWSGFARRWDWQCALDYAGGNVRNTGPHPLDQAMDLLGFPEDVTVFSRLACVNTFGDAEDYAKILLSVPGKPLVDIEISSCNAYAPYLYVISCRNGSLRAGYHTIEYQYFDPAQAPEQHLVLEPLKKPDGTPNYCGESLPWQTETVTVEGDVFTDAVQAYYTMIYDYLVDGKPMEIVPEQVLPQLKVIDMIHAQNPLRPRKL